MTDRVHSLTIALDSDIRTDDIQIYKNALMLMKGVIAVEENISDTSTWVAEERARLALNQKLWEALNGK